MGDNSRMYEAKYPEIDDLVMVQVKRIAEMGAYVELLEYNNIEGMILLSELSKRRIRSVSKLIRVGRFEVVSVVRVDHEKGYIDLSKKRVAAPDAVSLEEWYAKSKAVHSIMRHVASHTDFPLNELCEKIAWPLYKKFPHALDGMKKAVVEPDTLKFLELPEELMTALMAGVRRRLTPQMLRMRARVEVSCYEYEGIEAVKRALMKGIACSTEQHKVSIKLIAPPQYSVMCQDMEKDEGIELLTKAIAAVKASIEGEKGMYAVRQDPEICGDVEELPGEKGADGSQDSGSDSDESEQDESMGFKMDEEQIRAATGGGKE